MSSSTSSSPSRFDKARVLAFSKKKGRFGRSSSSSKSKQADAVFDDPELFNVKRSDDYADDNFSIDDDNEYINNGVEFEVDDDNNVSTSLSPSRMMARDAEHSLPVPEDMRTEAAIQKQTSHQKDGDEARAHFQKNRRLSYILFATAALSFVGVVGFLVAFLTRRDDGSSTTSAASKNGDVMVADPLAGKADDVNPVVWSQVYELLSTYTPDVKLGDLSLPQTLAANFMARQVQSAQVEVPPSRNYEDAYEFVQQYVLATLYYSTDGPNSWQHSLGFLESTEVCEWNIYGLDVAKAALTHISDVGGGGLVSDGPHDHVINGGKETVVGVQCNNVGEVIYLVLPDNGLTGDLPAELGLLEALQHISLYKNNITGPIPDSFEYLNDLRTLILEDNQMSGGLPAFMNEQWPKLQLFSLAYNGFDGELPSFEGMDQLTRVALNHNAFTGTLDVFDSTPRLEVLLLNNNDFNGSLYSGFLEDVPIAILDLSNNRIGGRLTIDFYDVAYLDVHNNQLTDYIPLPVWPDYDYAIRFLSVYGNPGLAGSEIPLHLGRLTRLTHLDLSGCGLTGKIPESVNELVQLRYLYLGDNDFDAQEFPRMDELVNLEELSLRDASISDIIPHWVGKFLTNLVLLDLSHNAITDTIPNNFSFFASLRFLLLSHNQLVGPIPDSLWDLRNLEMFTLNHNDQIAQGTSVGQICADDGPNELDIVMADCSLDCACCSDCCNANSPDYDQCGLQGSPNLDEGSYERNGYNFNDDVKFGPTNNENRKK